MLEIKRKLQMNKNLSLSQLLEREKVNSVAKADSRRKLLPGKFSEAEKK
jgi:hypothetical protein